MKHTLTLLAALLLASLAALHAADKPEPVASDDKLAAIMSRKPSGIPLAPILDPGPEFADGKRIWQGSGSMTMNRVGRQGWFAATTTPCPHLPLIEPDGRISRIRLSEAVRRFAS